MKTFVTFLDASVRTSALSVAAIMILATSPSHERLPAPSRASCLSSSLVNDSDILLLGMNGGGGTPTPFMLPHSGGMPANVVAVEGRLTKPTFLILTAYHPTIWDLSKLAGIPLRGVLASGFYGQGVTGLSRKTPIFFNQSAEENGGDSRRSDCPDLGWPHNRPEAMLTSVRLRRLLGRGVDEYYGSYEPFSFAIHSSTIPKYAALPRLKSVLSDGQVVVGDEKIQRRFADLTRKPSGVDKRIYDEELEDERRGLRLLHILWSKDGDIAKIEQESFGSGSEREQASAGQ